METGRGYRTRWRIAAAAHNIRVLIGQIACQSSSLRNGSSFRSAQNAGDICWSRDFFPPNQLNANHAPTRKPHPAAMTHVSGSISLVNNITALIGYTALKETMFKGAVCRILTLLKHKNTIICLQIFKKHAKLTYLFIWKTMLRSVILLWKCAVRPGMSVFVMVCETLPLPVYPIVFRHPGLPVGVKHSVFHFIHRHVLSFLLVSLNWQPVCASSQRRRGRVKKTISNILNLDCNT